MTTNKPLRTFLFFTLFVIAIGLQSCIKDNFDLKEKLSTEFAWNPELALPLANADLTLADLVQLKEDTIQYVSEVELGYGTNAEDYVIQMRYSIDSGRAIDFTKLPIMSPFDTTIYLDPVKLDDIKLDAEMPIPLVKLLQDFFTTQDLDDYNVYQANSPTDVTQRSSISTATKKLPPISLPKIDYIILTEGKMSVNLNNKYGVPVSCELVVYTDSLGNEVELGTFEFTNIAPGSLGKDVVTFNTTYLGSSISFEFKSFELGAQSDANIDLTDIISFDIAFENIVASEGRAEVPEQTITVDSLVYVGVHDENQNRKLRYLEIEEGLINYKITSTIDLATDFSTQFISMMHNGDTVTKHAKLDKNTPVVQSDWDLADHILDLTQNPTQAYNQMPIRLNYTVQTGNEKISFGPSQNINIQFTNKDSLVFSYIEGNYGKTHEELFSDTVEFNIDEFIKNFSTGEMTFYEPKLKLEFKNPIGIEGILKLNLIGENSNGEKIDLFAGHNNEFKIAAPSCDSVKEGLGVVTEIELNNTNSNISEFVSMLPNKIVYNGNFALNNSSEDEDLIYNCISNKGNAELSVDAELPMKISMKDFVLEQEVILNENNLDNENSEFGVDNIDYLRLYLSMENSIPLDARVEVYMLDTTQANPNLGLLTDAIILEAAPTNDDGKVERGVSVEKYSAIIDLSKDDDDDRLNQILKANKLLIKMYLETYGDGTKPIIFYTYYGMKFNLSVDTKFYYKDRL